MLGRKAKLTFAFSQFEIWLYYYHKKQLLTLAVLDRRLGGLSPKFPTLGSTLGPGPLLSEN